MNPSIRGRQLMADIAKSLAFDPKIFVIQFVLLLALLLAMNAIFWKPMLAHLKKRDSEIADAYSQRDRLQIEMEQLRADYIARLAQVEAEARNHIQKAIRDAQTERERLLADAREKSDAALKEGLANLEIETAEALRSMRGTMVSLASDAAAKALGSTVDTTLIRSAVEERMQLEAANG